MPVVYEAPCVLVCVCACHRTWVARCSPQESCPSRVCLHHLSAPPTCQVPAMEEEPMMVTWGSLVCRLEEMWFMTTSTVSIKPSTTALS